MTIATNTGDTKVETLSSVAKQSVASDWLPIAFTVYEEPLQMISINNEVNGWLTLIREELYSNPSVEDIFVSIEDSDVDVWVVIPKRDLTILHQLVEREWELLKTLVSGKRPPFLVDFHIIYRCGRNVEDLAPTRTIRLPRQVQ